VHAVAAKDLVGRQWHQRQTLLQHWCHRSILQTADFKQKGSICLWGSLMQGTLWKGWRRKELPYAAELEQLPNK